MSYDPTAKGEPFAAKIWECLRRNLEFKSLFPKIEGAGSEEAQKVRFQEEFDRLKRYENSFAQITLGFTLGETVARKKEEQPASPFWPDKINFDRTWPELPKLFQNFFIGAADGRLGSLPHLVSLPDEVDWHSRMTTVIAIPHFSGIRDRKQILAEIAKLLPEATISPKSFKPGGKVLGAPRDWGAYLFFEQWTLAGFDRDVAINLAAYQYCDEDASVGITVKKAKELKAHNNRADVRQWVQNIEAAIESVYP